jgi:hypothetical protein
MTRRKVPEFKAQTPEQLAALANSCRECLDSPVSVTQDEQGRLTFTYPASKHGHQLTAIPWDTSHDGQHLWKFQLDDLESSPIGTLEPLMICGLLHF